MFPPVDTQIVVDVVVDVVVVVVIVVVVVAQGWSQSHFALAALCVAPPRALQSSPGGL